MIFLLSLFVHHSLDFSVLSHTAENVLINAHGYPVIIDFGFAKYVTDKTFTLCGTPLYLAPEVVRTTNRKLVDSATCGLACLSNAVSTSRFLTEVIIGEQITGAWVFCSTKC